MSSASLKWFMRVGVGPEFESVVLPRPEEGQTLYVGLRHSLGETGVWRATHRGYVALNPRLDLVRFCRTQFDWGHRLPGALQLSLALLADRYRDPDLALRQHALLLERTVLTLPYWRWVLSEQDLDTALNLPPDQSPGGV